MFGSTKLHPPYCLRSTTRPLNQMLRRGGISGDHLTRNWIFCGPYRIVYDKDVCVRATWSSNEITWRVSLGLELGDDYFALCKERTSREAPRRVVCIRVANRVNFVCK